MTTTPQEQLAASWAVGRAVSAALAERGIVCDATDVAVVTVVIREGAAYAVALEPRPATIGEADAMAEAINSLWANVMERRRRLEQIAAERAAAEQEAT